jgi:hypothetical protein
MTQRSLGSLYALGLPLLLACDGKEPSDSESGGGNGGDPPTLVVNEVLASNTITIADELGEYDDYVEIYNVGTEPAELDGVYLSDDAALPTAWAIPQGTALPPGGFLLIWCDDGTGSEGLHATFKLDAAGDEVVLSYVAGGGEDIRLDWVQFGKQQTDLSASRIPDGADAWNAAATPTPGASNGT